MVAMAAFLMVTPNGGKPSSSYQTADPVPASGSMTSPAVTAPAIAPPPKEGPAPQATAPASSLAKQEPQEPHPTEENPPVFTQASATLATAAIAARAAPSFDCERAASPQERIICASDALSKLDAELSLAYQTAMSEPVRAASVREDQRNWVHKVRNACETEDCLARSYQARIKELSTL